MTNSSNDTGRDNAARERDAAARSTRLGLNAPCPSCKAAPGEACFEASAPGMTGAFTHNARLGIGARKW